MRKYLIGLFVCLLLVSVANAEILMTANPMGKGKWSVSLGTKYDQNYFDMGNISALFVDSIQYGFNERLDLFGSVGLGFSQKATEKPRTMDALTMSNLGVGLKYALFIENPSTRQFSFSLMAAIKAASISKSTMNSWQYSLGAIAGKRVNAIFDPYFSINYRLTSQAYGDYGQMDYTFGAGFGPDDRRLILEDTLQYVNFSGENFLDNQIALTYSIALN